MDCNIIFVCHFLFVCVYSHQEFLIPLYFWLVISLCSPVDRKGLEWSFAGLLSDIREVYLPFCICYLNYKMAELNLNIAKVMSNCNVLRLFYMWWFFTVPDTTDRQRKGVCNLM